VVFLVVIATLGVPRILKLLSRDSSAELRIIAVTGLVLLAAIWALQAGYSLALGAFILGVVVAGTRYKDELEGAFAPLHTIFGAVFFVAVGMLFDYRLLAEVWWLVIVVTMLTVLIRPLACACGLVAVGHAGANALKAGLALIPVGEFAFVMIQVGRSSKAIPEKFYALAVGVSLTTAILGPLVTRRSDRIVSALQKREPRALREMIAFYQGWLERLQARGSANAVWRLCRGRIVQSAVHLLFLSAFILSSRPIHDLAYAHVGRNFTAGFDVMFWSAFGIIVLAPIIVLWRNLEALAMIIAEGATQAAPRRELFRKVAETILKGVIGLVFFGWLLLLIPVGRLALWALVIAALAIVIWAPFFWRRLVHLHSKIEVDLRSRMKAAATLGSSTGLPGTVLERPQEWNLQIDEVTIPFASQHAGRRISDLAIRKNLGCSIMTIDRQGFLITNPTADERLYAGDKLLIVGAPEQLSKTEQLLRGGSHARVSEELEHITMETVDAPDQSAAVGRSLGELNLPARFGIQICGIERDGARLLAPSSDTQLRAGDKILVLGPHEGIQAFRNELSAMGA
jgi:CPA2 family monovalent cation:H+ antiporter-2